MVTSERDAVTRQIRDRLSIVDVVGTYVALKKSGSVYKALCPFHHERTPSFQVNPALNIFKCFGCGVGGDIFKFVQIRENVSFAEARRILADRAGVTLEASGGPAPQSRGPGKTELARINAWAQGIFRRHYESPAGRAARAYVAGRGITEATAADFGIGLALDRYEGLIEEARRLRIDLGLLLAAGLVKERDQGGVYDTFRHRLMFPIHDITERLVGFGGRTLGDDPAKYLNTPTTQLFDKSANLFAIERARHAARETGRLIVVEGYTDCIMAHQAGFRETVATLGTAMTDAHAAILRRLTDRVVLLFDSDEAGQRAADRALSVALMHGLEVTLARVPEGKDPCDYILTAGAAAFEEVLNRSQGALEFKWQQVAAEYRAGSSVPARRRAIEAYLHQLATWGGHGVIDPIQRGLLVNQLSDILGMPAEDIHRQLARMTRRVAVAAPVRADGPASRPSVEAGVVQGQPPLTAEIRAQRQIVAALLNDPGQFARVHERFDPAAIADPQLAGIARVLMDWLRNGRPFSLDEFLGCFEAVEDAQLITELHLEGQRSGQHAEVIDSALACLVSCAETREAARLAEEIRRGRRAWSGLASDTVPAGEDEKLLALTERARQAHFLPASVRKRTLGGTETGW